jgi:hypothetical protein
VLPEQRVLICAIEKNALTTINQVAHTVVGSFEHPGNPLEFWFRFSPKATNLSTAAMLKLLEDPEWRFGFIYRDPIERFLSAYNSKCAMFHRDGMRHCQGWLNLTQVPSLSQVLRALRQRKEAQCMWDPHWAPQHCFCGDGFRVGDLQRRNNSVRISHSNVEPGLLQLFHDRLPQAALERVLRVVRKSAEMTSGTAVFDGQTSVTAATSAVAKLRGSTRADIATIYATDFELFQSSFSEASGQRNRYVFIAGLHHSGTSLAYRLIANQPGVRSLQYTRAGANEDEGQHMQDLWPTVSQRIASGRCLPCTVSLCLPVMDQIAIHGRGYLRRELLRQWGPYWVTRAKSSLSTNFVVHVEKDPDMGSAFVKLRLFGRRATLVFVMRHPFTAASQYGEQYRCKKAATCIHSWTTHWLYVLRHLPRMQFSLVRYEDFAVAHRDGGFANGIVQQASACNRTVTMCLPSGRRLDYHSRQSDGRADTLVNLTHVWAWAARHEFQLMARDPLSSQLDEVFRSLVHYSPDSKG